MRTFFEKFDSLAGIGRSGTFIKWSERAAFFFMLLMIAAAPHSIAATQTAWIIGTLIWFSRFLVKPRPQVKFTKLDAALWAFFGWSVLSSLTSYAPDISIDKLRGVIVFLILYFVLYNLRNLRAVYFAAFLLIISCLVNVVWTPIDRLIGRGVEVHGLAPDGPLAKALFKDGDTLLEADGKKIRTPEELLAAVASKETTAVKFYRPDYYWSYDVKRADLFNGSSALERLGAASWQKSSNWRSQGFYNHYTTYAEVLQLILSLIFGLLVASLRKKDIGDAASAPFHRLAKMPLLLVCTFLFGLALLLTVTRASQLSFMISAALIILLGAGRKWIWRAALIGIPVVAVGLIFVQQSRHVGFFDTKDDSIKWRETVWREGVDLWTKNARNLVVGVGMDSKNRFEKEWHLFDDGRLNSGHFHSTPLQLVVERGFPALLLWLLFLWFYGRGLLKALGKAKLSGNDIDIGILLGCFGGMIGFFTSGLIHYNLGDTEVAMVFFILAGIGIRLSRNFNENTVVSINSSEI